MNTTTTTNYGLGKREADELYDIEVMNSNMDAIDAKMKENEEHYSSVEKSISDHVANESNPHGVTKSQVGLGNCDNTSDANKPVSTATQNALNLKANKSDLSSHTGNTSNPHGVTKAQVGLESVPNVATNDQTPTYTAASSNVNLTFGEKLSVAFGKIAKAISSLISHLANTSNPHSVNKAQVGLGNAEDKSSELE